MELTGKILFINPPVSGETKNGTWKKQEFVIETNAQYPKKVCFSLWGDRIDKFTYKIGDEVTVSFDLESKEYNGRWFTDARTWMVKKAVSEQHDSIEPPPIPESFQIDENDDLPF